MKRIKVFSPASVSNVCCGFDVLGFSISGIGDQLIISESKSSKVNIKKVNGYNVPYERDLNTASVAGQSLIDHLKVTQGFDIEIDKNIKPGSGIGSSASSAVGAVYGINKLLGCPLNKNELVQFAMKGELVSSKSAPADNISSSLFGGLILVNNRENHSVIKLPVPNNLYAVIHHPNIEIKTSYSRVKLPEKVPLNIASEQLAYIAGFIHSLHTSDFELMKISLQDYLVENHRKDSLPYFEEIKKVVMENNAICCSISGSGPSIFCLVNGFHLASKVKVMVDSIFINKKIQFNSYVTSLKSKGVHEIL